jgi:pyruvate dehydrogenase E2 component (dihydrolipoamide acetyltransferase)
MAETVLGASPIARRAALALGVALEALVGSGARGRVVKADVVAAANGHATASAPVAAPLPAPLGGGVPDFAIELDVDMTAAVALHAQLAALAGEEAPTLDDIVVKAVAHALRRHPRVNGSYRDGRFESYERVNICVADGSTPPTAELADATFTILRLGVDRFTATVVPPQAAVLCVGTIAPRAAVGAGGELVAREQLTLTLVSDHRILYGADAARFLDDVRAALEAPLTVLL